MSATASARGRLFTAGDAAAFLGVTRSRVYKLLRRRELASVRTAGGRLEGIYEADCRAWQDQRTTPAHVEADVARQAAQIDVDRRTRELPGAEYFAQARPRTTRPLAPRGRLQEAR